MMIPNDTPNHFPDFTMARSVLSSAQLLMAMLTTSFQETITMFHSSAKHFRRCRNRLLAPRRGEQRGSPQFNGFVDLLPPAFEAFLQILEELFRPNERYLVDSAVTVIEFSCYEEVYLFEARS
jgi:hypothetical protein